MKGSNVSLEPHVPDEADRLVLLAGMLVGSSTAMHNVAALVRQVAHFPNATVLLQGESGTGKDVVAHAIHTLSARAPYDFVDINCASIPEALFETELFGVEAGAYTDARVSRDGHLKRTTGGTLFLDEIGSMPLSLQAKLLRFLETRTFRPVGSTRELHVDLRVISATNLNLQAAVARKVFRDDLFYRLKVMTIYLPPLRERPEDIDLLVEHFLRIYSIDGQEPLRISPDALELMRRYSWPGNVRELRSAIEHGQILYDGHEIRPDDLPETLRSCGADAEERLYALQHQLHLPSTGLDLPAFLATIEYTLIQEALEQCNGNQVHAAALLHMSRDQLRYRLQHANGG